MSALGQLLGRAYANQYGAKYELPVFGTNSDEQQDGNDNLDISQFAVGASQGVPLQTSPSPVPIAPKAPATPTWLDMTMRNVVSGADYAFGLGKFISGFRYLEDQAKPLTASTSPIVRGIGTVGEQYAGGMRNLLQEASPTQNLLNTANIVTNFIGNIFGHESTVIPKLDNYSDQDAAGFANAKQVGHIAGDLAQVVAAIYTGGAGGASFASKFPALATAIEDVPGMSGTINTVSKIPGVAGVLDATGLGTATVGNVLGTGTGNALLSALGDSREVLEDKKKVKNALIDASAAFASGTLYGGATSPTTSLAKRVLAEGLINTGGGAVQEAPALLRGETTPQQYGMNVGIQAAAGVGLPLLGAVPGGIKQMVRKTGNTELPIETPIEPNAPASVSQAAVDQARTTTGTPDEIALQQTIDREKYSKEVEGFVKKHFKNKSSREDLGMGMSSKEIADNLVNHSEQNPSIIQVMDDINSGNAKPEDLISVVRNPRPTEPVVQEPVVAENLTTETPPINPDHLTPEQIGGMSHEELSKHYTTHAVDNPVENTEISGKLPESNVQEMHVAEEPALSNSEVSPTLVENAPVESKTIDGITYERPKPFVSFDEANTPAPAAENVVVGKPTSVLFNTETEPAHYVVHPSDYSVPSHRNGIKNPHNFLGNPQAKEGRAGVEYVNGILEDWKPENMSGTDKSAFTNAPKTILPNGEPIQGNTRAELEQRIYENPSSIQAQQLKQHILDNAEHFGVNNPEQRATIEAMDNPTVSRVVNPTKERANELLNIHQDEAAWAKTPTDKSTLRVSKVSPESEKRAFAYLEDELSKEENSGKTFSQMLEKNNVRQDIATILSNGDQKTMRVYNDDVSADNGKNAIEFDLRSMVLGRDEDAIKKFNALPNKYKETINANLANILRLGDDKLGKDFKEAIQGVFDYSKFKGSKQELNQWLNQIDMNGHVNEDKYGKGAVELMRLMDTESPATVRKVLSEYAAIPKDYRDGNQGGFGEAPRTHAELLAAAKKKVITQEIKNGTRLHSTTAPIIAAVANLAAQTLDDDKEYFGIKGSDLKKAVAVGTAGGAMGYYGHRLIRSLKVALPETAPRVLERIKDTTIPGYEDVKLKVSEIKKPVIENLVGKARADGMTDELLAHYVAFMEGQPNNPKYIDRVQAELFGNAPNPKAEMDAADYLLKQTIHAHNTATDLPVMSSRLHDLILNTIDERASSINNPETTHVANLMQGRELSLPEKPIESMPAEFNRIQDSSDNWEQDLYSIATGDDPALTNVLDKLKNRERLSDDEIQTFKKYIAEKEVWNKSVTDAAETNDWDSVLKMKDSIDDPVRKAAFSEFVATKLDDVAMDKIVNGIAAENGLQIPEPTPNYKPKSQAIYSSVIPFAPESFSIFKKMWDNKALRYHTAATIGSWLAADNVIFPDDDKQYLGMPASEARLLFAAIGGAVLAPHLRRKIFLKFGSVEMRAKMHDLINRESLLAHDIKNTVANDPKFIGKEGTKEYAAEIKRKEAAAKTVDEGLSNATLNVTSIGGAALRKNPAGERLLSAQIDASMRSKEQQKIISDLEKDYNKLSTPAQQRAESAYTHMQEELSFIRSAKVTEPERELMRIRKMKEFEAQYFDGNPDAKQAYEILHQKASHARQIDIEAKLYEKLGVKWNELDDAIEKNKQFTKAKEKEIEERLAEYANANSPARKSELRYEIGTLQKNKRHFVKLVDNLEYMKSLPERSNKYHYIPHFYDKNGEFKYAVYDEAKTDPDGNKLPPEIVSFHKFESQKQAETWLAKFRREREEGKHSYGEPVRKGIPVSKSSKNAQGSKLDAQQLLSLAYGHDTANWAKTGMGKEKVEAALKELDSWNDISPAMQQSLLDSMENNVSPKTLRHIIDEIWSPNMVNLEKRNNVGGYIDFDPRNYLVGKSTPKDITDTRKWLLGGIDHMMTNGRVKLEKSAILTEAQNLRDEYLKEGYVNTAAYKWLSESVIDSLTSKQGLTSKQARTAGKIRSALGTLVLAGNIKHGVQNYALGSISTLTQASIEANPFKSAAYFVMAHAQNLPGGTRFAGEKMKSVIEQLNKYDYGESSYLNSVLAQNFKSKKTAKNLMMASVVSEAANNKIASTVFAKIALDRGASIDEAVKFGLTMRQQTQYAFTPWMTSAHERKVRNMGFGVGSVAMTLMGAALRSAEHSASIIHQVIRNPGSAAIPAAGMLLMGTLFGGIYGDVWGGTVLKSVDFINSLNKDEDDTTITRENSTEHWQRKAGDMAEKVGLPRDKGENLHKVLMQGLIATSTDVNFAQENTLFGLLKPLAYSEGAGVIAAINNILSDKSLQEKALGITKLSTVVNRATRSAMQLAGGHPMDNKGNVTSDKAFIAKDAAIQLGFGRPASDTWNAQQKAAGGGDLRDEYSKQQFVSSLYAIPGLTVGSEKNEVQRAKLTENAQTIRREIQKRYDGTNKEREADVKRINDWAEQNKELLNWIDRNGGAEVAGNITAPSKKALTTNIEKWYTGKASSEVLNEMMPKNKNGGNSVNFHAGKGAAEFAVNKLLDSGSKKIKSAQQKREYTTLFPKEGRAVK